MFCYRCGKEIPDNNSCCPHCGADVPQQTASKKSVTLFTLSNRQITWLLICCIWIAVFFIGKAIYDEDDLFYVLTFGVPVVVSLILLLVKNIKKSKKVSRQSFTEISLSEFMKQFDSVKLDKVANKYTGDIKQFIVCSKEQRISFDETIHCEMTPKYIENNKEILKVRRIGENNYIISKSNNHSY